MRRKESTFASSQVQQSALHLAALVRQARLARGWSQAALAARARISAPTMHRIEQGAVETSLGGWLSVLELLGLLPLVNGLRDPVSEAVLNETRAKRPRRAGKAVDLDF